MSYLDFPFLPEAMGGRSRDSRRFCSHEEVRKRLGMEHMFTPVLLIYHERHNSKGVFLVFGGGGTW
jgi:hypothetical protein